MNRRRFLATSIAALVGVASRRPQPAPITIAAVDPAKTGWHPSMVSPPWYAYRGPDGIERYLLIVGTTLPVMLND